MAREIPRFIADEQSHGESLPDTILRLYYGGDQAMEISAKTLMREIAAHYGIDGTPTAKQIAEWIAGEEEPLDTSALPSDSEMDRQWQEAAADPGGSNPLNTDGSVPFLPGWTDREQRKFEQLALGIVHENEKANV